MTILTNYFGNVGKYYQVGLKNLSQEVTIVFENS